MLQDSEVVRFEGTLEEADYVRAHWLNVKPRPALMAAGIVVLILLAVSAVVHWTLRESLLAAGGIHIGRADGGLCDDAGELRPAIQRADAVSRVRDGVREARLGAGKKTEEKVVQLATDGLIVIYTPKAEDIDFPENFVLFPEVNERGWEDFYLGCDFSNFEKAAEWAGTHNLPLVWANPVKFIRSPERLILLRAITRKIPYPPERERMADTTALFGTDQEALALKKFGSAAQDAFRRTSEIAEKCRFAFEDIVPPLPPDLFPTTLRDLVMDRLRSAGNVSWRERERARHEHEIIEKSGFAPYFLVVHDVIEFARRRRILHNLKGSGAAR